MSAVLVTGGMGSIGSWVTRRLVQQGKEVVVYQRHRDTTLLKDIVPDFHYAEGDVLDLPKLIHTIQSNEVEYVIHMATLLVNPLEANPYMGYRVNVDGAMNILEASRLMNVKRVVCISSRAVYDSARGEYTHPTYKPMDEDYPKAPRTVYGATKLFIENMGLSYHRIYGLDFVALRFASTYGPGKLARGGPTSIHSQIIESALAGKAAKINESGDHLDDMLYHRDIAEGVVLACFARNLEHRVFQLGTGKGETLSHLLAILSRMFGPVRIELGAGAGKASWVNYSIFNIDRARRELGFEPRYDLEKGVRDYVDTMREFGIPPGAVS